MICDLERRQIIDILPDPEATSVEAWLKAHPDIKIIPRDNGGGYGHAVTGALAGARQVAGCRSGAELWRRLQVRGFRGSSRVVAEWTTRRRRNDATPGSIPRKCPSARVITRFVTMARDQLSRSDAILVAKIEATVPALSVVRDLVDRFHKMIQRRRSEELPAWLEQARSTTLASFVNGLNADHEAVVAAIVEPWSNGQIEGQITKLKLMKRQMYGRAKLNLLKARLIHPSIHTLHQM